MFGPLSQHFVLVLIDSRPRPAIPLKFLRHGILNSGTRVRINELPFKKMIGVAS